MERRLLHLFATTNTVADAFEAFAAARGFDLRFHTADWSAALGILPLPEDVLIADLDRGDDVRGFFTWRARLAFPPQTVLISSLEAEMAAALSHRSDRIAILSKPLNINEFDAVLAAPSGLEAVVG